jgi:hypothetical protein
MSAGRRISHLETLAVPINLKLNFTGVLKRVLDQWRGREKNMLEIEQALRHWKREKMKHQS